MGETALVHTEHLYKEFRSSRYSKNKAVKAVNDVSIDIYRGEVLGVVGESGCGKSTLARSILHLTRPTSGKVIYDGIDVGALKPNELRELRKRMQIIFQDPYGTLNPKMNIGDAVRAPLDAFKIGTMEERNEKVLEILDMVGMGKQHISRYPHEFSGGQRQRIDIARALILRPEFVVCDEPVSALDVSIRAQVLNIMVKFRKEMKLTYLFISHDLSVVKHISNRIAVMYLGEIVELATTKELYDNPLHPYTQVLFSAIPIPEVNRVRKHLTLQGEIPNIYNIPKGCALCTRCPYAMEKCHLEKPVPKVINEHHTVSCFLYDD